MLMSGGVLCTYRDQIRRTSDGWRGESPRAFAG